LKDAIRRCDSIAGALKKGVRTRCKYVLLSRERGGRHYGLLLDSFAGRQRAALPQVWRCRIADIPVKAIGCG
jgi:hypothetical protein